MNISEAKDQISACVALCGPCDEDTENGPCHAEEKAFIKGYESGRRYILEREELKRLVAYVNIPREEGTLGESLRIGVLADFDKLKQEIK